MDPSPHPLTPSSSRSFLPNGPTPPPPSVPSGKGGRVAFKTAAGVGTNDRRRRVIRSQRAGRKRSVVINRLRVAIDLSFPPASDKETRSLVKQLAMCVGLQREYAHVELEDGRRSVDRSAKSRRRILQTALQIQSSDTSAVRMSPYPADLYFVFGLDGHTRAMAHEAGLAKWDDPQLVSVICVEDTNTNTDNVRIGDDIDEMKMLCTRCRGVADDHLTQNDSSDNGSRLVYLSPDADDLLDWEAETKKGDGNTIFMIGGIVDLEATPRMSLRRASQLDHVDAVCRLPVREMVHGGVRRGSLTINQCFQVLIQCDAGATMNDALTSVLRAPK